MSEKERSTYAIQTVENALCILEAISEESGEFGVSHLSSKLGMNRSYIFRMLATFAEKGYVQQDETSGLYRAGLTAYETGGRFFHQMELLKKAKPVMDSLARLIGEAVYLAVPDENDLLLLEMVDSPQQIRVVPLVGRRYPLDHFSAGKVVLAYNANCEELRDNLSMIAAEGACVDYGTVDEGVCCLAVPIFNAQGGACASLCMMLPEFRANPDWVNNELLPLLKETGEEISAKLGHIKAEFLKLCG